MFPPTTGLERLTPALLAGMRRGVEKESLRVDAHGRLALTPHPGALGSALTHEHITTDYSESQVELVTGVHAEVNAVAQELAELHQYTARVLARQDETLWAASMPCGLPADENIPLGRYGTSNIGRAKSVYRMGLGHRYGRRMQTICGIHYNWSLPGVSSAEYLALIRNFRRHGWLLLLLFGASPAVCPSFVEGREHGLEPLSPHTLHLPHATSLRMGRLGYQSEAQAQIRASFNNLEDYAASLHQALTQPHPPYERIGIRNLGGEYNQLSTTLLQIENEFYGTIRPKRVIRPGERPLHALRQRGVEYVEVRCMDLDPFEALGIGQPTMHFLDCFLLLCLLHDSPPDTPEEIAANARNQHLVASRGREPGLLLERDGWPVDAAAWAGELLQALVPIAEHLDACLPGAGQAPHAKALEQARQQWQQPDRLPSARVLAAVQAEYEGRFTRFARAASAQARQAVLASELAAAAQARLERQALASVQAQQRLEAADDVPFETWRLRYLDAAHLVPQISETSAQPTAEAHTASAAM
jgi:glutamate--cysteine ligase